MSSYTKGKWEYNWHEDGCFLGLEKNGCYVICQKPKPNADKVQAIAMLPPDHAANARLIASAPQLLAACEYALKFHEEVALAEYQVVQKDQMKTLEAAIAAAKS